MNNRYFVTTRFFWFTISTTALKITRITTEIYDLAYFWCCQMTFSFGTLTFLSIIVLRTFWRSTINCVVYSDLKKLILQKNESTCEHFSSISFYNFRRGLSRQERIDELKSLVGDKAPSYSAVKNWFNEFNRGRSSLKDEVREAPPKTAVVSENIDVVRELIMQDRLVTYREIEPFLGISRTSIHLIL